MIVKITQARNEKTEDCGVVGIYSFDKTDISPFLYLGLQYIQHRGQDAAGMTIYDSNFHTTRGLGLISNVITKRSLEQKGWIGIGHTRYPTTGHSTINDVQPSTSEETALAHNGHVANYDDLKNALETRGINLLTKVDSEVILRLFDEKKGSIEEKVKYIMKNIDGSYAVVAIFDNKLIAFRDPQGIRPLVFGKTKDHHRIMFASESCALSANGIYETEDVKGGELIIVSEEGIQRKRILNVKQMHCMFEYVYFSRPDSKINGKLVMTVRKNLGWELAKESPVKADVVIPVPDTSRTAATEYGHVLGIPVEEGLIKNRYVGRTFIMSSQSQREHAIRLKLNPVKEIIDGKNVVLIDDSIVRGTTMRGIIKLVKSAGAKKIHIRITSPPIKAPCFYGVDMPTYEELIASKKSIKEIAEYLGADSLKYLSVRGLAKAINVPLCTACLGGEYPTKKGKELAKLRMRERNDRSTI